MAAVLGVVVGAVLLLTENTERQYRALITVGMAFGVSVCVFTLTRSASTPVCSPL